MRGPAGREANMKGNNILVASLATGIATAPFLAFHLRPADPPDNGSLDDWLVAALSGGNCWKGFLLTFVVCAVVGLLVGMVLKSFVRKVNPTMPELTIFRTPLAVAILAPLAIASCVMIVYNHTPRALEAIVWPEFYARYWILHSIAVASAAAIAAGLVNELERTFANSVFFAKIVTLCCLPFAVCLGLASLLGMIGGGLLAGLAVGRWYECPLAGAWTGVCVAVIVLAVEGNVFWPLYFPHAKHGGEPKKNAGALS
jgi:hypothetical protein